MPNMIITGFTNGRSQANGGGRWGRICLGCLTAILGITMLPTAAMAQRMVASVEEGSGAVVLTDGGKPVLRYNYETIEPPEGYAEQLPDEARKYARPRSNYIHPLYGPGGEQLTDDWADDHPHHRGIYWAWPEVQYRGEMGDLHALQRVFARPTGELQLRDGDDFAQIEAENRWLWEDKTPIVREKATMRAWPADAQGRNIDLTFEFLALEEGVTLARRGTKRYGGLNIRLAPIEGLAIRHHADPADRSPRFAWQLATGTWRGAKQPATLVVFEHAGNPHYPADFVPIPHLPWFQPTFPKAGVRYALSKSEPLVLRYRLSIHSGGMRPAEIYARQWQAWQDSP